MLSTFRVTGRQAVAREANLRAFFVGARYASAWSNVPQGPPVSLDSIQFGELASLLRCALLTVGLLLLLLLLGCYSRYHRGVQGGYIQGEDQPGCWRLP